MARWVVKRSGASNPKRADDIDISPSEDGCIVSRPGKEKIHFLNPTAVLVLEFCTGENSPDEIAALIQAAYRLTEPPADDVQQILARLKSEGLLS